MRNLFCSNSKNPHPACVIYEGISKCKENNHLNHHLPPRHLKNNSMHAFR